MKEIKFRIWDDITKKFYYWGFIDDCFRGIPSSNYGDFSLPTLKKKSEQFTGLLDKNGKEIYEGDIIKHEYGFGNGQGIVEYLAPEFTLSDKKSGFCSEFLGRTGVSIEVIGNIHEKD